jgi:hypothetical protein
MFPGGVLINSHRGYASCCDEPGITCGFDHHARVAHETIVQCYHDNAG